MLFIYNINDGYDGGQYSSFIQYVGKLCVGD